MLVDEVKGTKLNHLVLAEGEVTNHKHQVIDGDCCLYDDNGKLYLSVKEEGIVIHEDHNAVKLPVGDYEIIIQKEYAVGDEKYRNVAD